MSAFEYAYAHILDAVAGGAGAAEQATAEAPIDRFSRVFRDYLEALASDPVVTRVFLIEVYAVGPAAVRRRVELQAGLAAALAAVVHASDEDRFAIEALVAGVVGLVTARLAADDVAGLRELDAPVVALVRRLGLA